MRQKSRMTRPIIKSFDYFFLCQLRKVVQTVRTATDHMPVQNLARIVAFRAAPTIMFRDIHE